MVSFSNIWPVLLVLLIRETEAFTICGVEDEVFSSKSADGTECNNGFICDIVSKIGKEYSQMQNPTWIFDDKYGKKDEKTKKWSGALGRMVNDGACDLAAASFTMSNRRIKDGLKFTAPIMRNDLMFITYRGTASLRAQGSCLVTVFGWDVWLTLVLAIVIAVGVCALIYHLEGRGRCDSICDATWFILSALTLQGHECTAPKKTASRVLAIFWWFFVLVMVAAYIGAISGALAEGETTSTISLADVKRDDKYMLQCTAGGTTEQLLTKNAQFADLREPTNRIEPKTPEGPKKIAEMLVSNKNRIYVGEEYYLRRVKSYSADLDISTDVIASRFASFVVRDDMHRKGINEAISKLQENGEIGLLIDKYWPSAKKASSGKAEPLNIQHAMPAFILLLVGILVALIIVGIGKFRGQQCEGDRCNPAAKSGDKNGAEASAEEGVALTATAVSS